jgi:hypothetical protein
MWQAPNSRAHSIAAARKKARDRVKNSVHFKRVAAEVRLSNDIDTKMGEARIVLNDFSPKGVEIFAGRSLAGGQAVDLTLRQPREIFIRGTVVDCHTQIEASHVISEHNFSYRITIKFEFETEEEREQIRLFCESILRQHIRPQAA